MTGFPFSRPAAFAIVLAAFMPIIIPDEDALATVRPSLDCRAAGPDMQVHGFDPSLRIAALSAYRVLFPHASGPPSDDELANDAKIRCMDGGLLVCFVGANAPCARMNASVENAGADAFCRASHQSGDVSASATGHDSIYVYRCQGGRAVVSGQIYRLDGQGYARELWAAADNTSAKMQARSSAQASGSTSAVDPIEERSKDCLASPEGQTAGGMAECSRRAYLAYDRQLNDVYEGVLKRVDSVSASLIRDAQRKWVALQQADQAADNGPWRNDRGSMATPDIEALRIDAIRQRIAKLRYYDPGP